MTLKLEIILLAASILAIVVIFVLELLRRYGSIRLRAPMLLAFRIFLGIVFMILAVIGGFIPVMQGWIFFLLAILVLFPKSRFAVRALEKAEPKAPRIVARLRRWGIGTRDDTER